MNNISKKLIFFLKKKNRTLRPSSAYTNARPRFHVRLVPAAAASLRTRSAFALNASPTCRADEPTSREKENTTAKPPLAEHTPCQGPVSSPSAHGASATSPRGDRSRQPHAGGRPGPGAGRRWAKAGPLTRPRRCGGVPAGAEPVRICSRLCTRRWHVGGGEGVYTGDRGQHHRSGSPQAVGGLGVSLNSPHWVCTGRRPATAPFVGRPPSAGTAVPSHTQLGVGRHPKQAPGLTLVHPGPGSCQRGEQV